MHDFIELAAVIASAVYGVILARRHGMDFVGVFCLSFVVAFGGGTLRDLLLDRHPMFWIREHHYPVIVFSIALGMSLLPHVPKRVESLLQVPDALGLGLFTVAGTAAAVEEGTSMFVAALLGAVTGTFGGVIGDVIVNRVPSLFRPAPLFATCSFSGAWVFLFLDAAPATRSLAPAIATAVVVGFRLASIRWNWSLPNIEEDGSDSSNKGDS
ncbi:MAG: trimeric intracellular cation channel family protein [Planctomycetota bacterium]